MKKIITLLFVSFMFTSCYVHKTIVGQGAQSGMVEKATQHNFLGGLVSGKTPNTQEMAKGAKDYEVTTQHTFINGLVSGITFSLYNPTTVEVKR